jgi:antagonist of KipI
MSIRVIKSGIWDTVQDPGRTGYQHWGVNPGGAMDRHGLMLANLLVGNAANDPALELHFPSAQLLFIRPAVFVLTGGDFAPRLNGKPIPLLQPILAGADSYLQFGKPQRGSCVYMAVRGGLMADRWLGSHSTDTRVVRGGYQGRRLMKGDEIATYHTPVASLPSAHHHIFSWKAPDDLLPGAQGVFHHKTGIGFIRGPEWDHLTAASKDAITQTVFCIGPRSDRMGYRLEHPPLERAVTDELPSSAVSFGTVQLLPDGQLIVLMAGHQTTGGYPRVAQVITAHHGRMAQLRMGEKLRFVEARADLAERLFRQQRQYLHQLGLGAQLRWSEWERSLTQRSI